MKKNDTEIVSALCAALSERIGGDRYELWFSSGVRLQMQGHVLQVVARDRFLLERVRNSFREELQAVCRQTLGEGAAVEFRLDEQSSVAADPQAVSEGPQSETSNTSDRHERNKDRRNSAPRVGRSLARLSQFVVGDSNKLAHTGAQAVIDRPGRITPLFVHGPSGTGKTHLLEAITVAARRERGLRRVVMLSAEQFTSSFLEALRGSGLPNFRRKYRDVELLLIDDLQFFAGKSATIVELLYTVDSLLRDGRQVVLTANRSPAELGALGGELVGRISGGLVCGVEAPDEATRFGIAQRMAMSLGTSIAEDVLRMLAAKISGDARLIAGAINRLTATSEALSRPVTMDLAESTLSDFFHMARRVVRLADIESAVCDVFGIDGEKLHSNGKSKALSQPRMLAMWLARKYTRAAYTEIGQFFGRRSHSTVISAQKKVEGWVSDGGKVQLGYGDCDVRDAIRRVETRLGTG